MNCSVAQCLEVVGEWWSMLIVRDAFLGVTRFDDFQSRLGISRNILNQRLTHLVDNLLDMSRLQAGALSLFPRPVGLDEIVSRALDSLDPAAQGITVAITESLPESSVDPALLALVTVNLDANELRYAPAGQPPVWTPIAPGARA